MTKRRRLLIAATMLVGVLVACNPVGPSAAPSASTATTTASPTSAGATTPASEPAMTVGPEPTAVDTGPGGTPPCAIADLKASHGLVEGAAGSRLTEVVLVSATTCSVDAFPALGLRDASGTPLIDAPPLGPGAIDLVAGVAYTSQVRLANWCAPEPAFPLGLALIIGDDELEATGSSFPDEGDMPPCEGAGDPILEASAWLPTP